MSKDLKPQSGHKADITILCECGFFTTDFWAWFDHVQPGGKVKRVLQKMMKGMDKK